MSLSERLKSLQERRIEAEMKISTSQSQLGNLSTTLNALTNRKNSLNADLTRLRQDKEAISSLLK